MKKPFITLIIVFSMCFCFFACDLTDIFDKADTSKFNEKVDNKEQNDQGNDKKISEIVEEIKFSKVDFFDEYGLTLEFIGIWNDYMPGWGWKLTSEGESASICTIHISSSASLPLMEISVNIITENIRFDSVKFSELYKEEQFGVLYPGKFWKDYRPDIGFRVGDYDKYIMEINIKIDDKHQVLTVADKSGVTH